MRLLALALAGFVIPACYVTDPPANGLDGQLYFTAPGESAVGTTTVIAVTRGQPDSTTCVIGKGGDTCEGGSYDRVVIDSASCGDGCTATISGDAPGLLNVVESAPGDHVLVVTTHAVHGSGTWTDRFALHASIATAFAVVSADRQPLGVAYATEVGARMPLYVCPLAAPPPADQLGDLECLAGDFPQDVSGDGVVHVTPSITIANDNPLAPAHQPFAVELAAAGTGHLHVTAFGMTRTIALRAASPAEWTRIEFAPFDVTAGDVRDITESGFVGTPTSAMTLDLGNTYMTATAVLADGSRVLLSASRISCQPANRLVAKLLNLSNRTASWSPDGVGLWASMVDVPDYTAISPGDATCVVTGHEALGSLAVHVD